MSEGSDAKGPRLQITCQCGWSGKVSGRWAGKKVRCKECASAVRVPTVLVAKKVDAPKLDRPPVARLIPKNPPAPRARGAVLPDDEFLDDEFPDDAPNPDLQRVLALLRDKRVRVGVLACGAALALCMVAFTAYTRSNSYLFSVATDTSKRGMARRKAKRRLLDGAAPEELSKLLADLDGRKRGNYPDLIEASQNPAYVPDMVASLEDRDMDRKLQAILSFGPKVTCEALFPVFEASSGRLRTKVRETLLQVPARQLKRQVLTLSDPALRGSFPEVLATTQDPEQVEAIKAWLLEEETVGRWPRARDAMLSLDRDRARRAMIEAYTGTKLEGVRWTLNKRFSSSELVADVLKIEDSALQGGFPDALAHDGDPKHADAILAFARSRPDLDTKEFVSALVVFGPRVIPRLQARLETDDDAELKLAYGALAKLDAEAVSKHVAGALQRYQEGVTRILRRRAPRGDDDKFAALLEKLRAQQRGSRGPEDPFKSIRATHAPLRPLKALRGIEGQQFDFCFLFGLTSNDRVVAEFCAEALDERLDRDGLIDAIFGYVAHKESFAMEEANLYKRLLIKTGKGGTKRIAHNLERLLEKAGGQPEGVFFILKILAFRALEAIGTRDALPILQRYAADKGSFILETTTTGGIIPSTNKSEDVILFATEARKAIQAIQSR